MKLIVFDCDGTLVDSQHMICAAMQKAFGDHALPCPPRERLLSIVGLSLAEAFHRLGEGADGFPVATLVERYKNAFFLLRQSDEFLEPLYPGAQETIETLSARGDVLLGIATGKSQRGVRAVLDRHGLLARFHTIKTADDAPSKPHPGMLIAAMEEAGVAPSQTALIGDTTYDMEMARAAGATAIGVSWGYHAPAMLRDSGAAHLVNDFARLRTLLASL
jgi:phosphoglycolate phosphatase